MKSIHLCTSRYIYIYIYIWLLYFFSDMSFHSNFYFHVLMHNKLAIISNDLQKLKTYFFLPWIYFKQFQTFSAFICHGVGLCGGKFCRRGKEIKEILSIAIFCFYGSFKTSGGRVESRAQNPQSGRRKSVGKLLNLFLGGHPSDIQWGGWPWFGLWVLLPGCWCFQANSIILRKSFSIQNVFASC